MPNKIINFIPKSKALLGLCLTLAIASNFLYFNIFTNANPLSVISQNPTNITFGVSIEKESIPNNINLVSGPWILNSWEQYNTDWLSKFTQPDNINKTPYLYLYIAAGKAKADWNLEDCNVGVEKSKTLCYRGAEYLRSNREQVKQAYINTANNIKTVYSATKEIALHIEPDFYQYTDSGQLNGGLSFNEAAKDLNLWTDSIKQILPNARLVMDVSPWNSNLAVWSGGLRNFDYAGIVGKAASPRGDGSVSPAGLDGKSYAKISQDTGKQLILDDSHGVGGYWLPFDYDWSNKSLAQDRLNDGVVAVLLPPNDPNFLNGMVKSSPAPIVTQPASSSSSSLVKISSSISYSKPASNPISSVIRSSQFASSKVAIQVVNTTPQPIPTNQIIVEAPVSNYKSSQISSSQALQSVASSNFSQITCSANSVDFTLTKGDSWQSGFVTNIKVKNNSQKPLNSWDINLLPSSNQNIDNSWNLKRDGNYITPDAGWNSQIQPGQEFNVGGFVISHSGNTNLPSLRCGTY
jgi:Cellulose binding domain